MNIPLYFILRNEFKFIYIFLSTITVQQTLNIAMFWIYCLGFIETFSVVFFVPNSSLNKIVMI